MRIVLFFLLAVSTSASLANELKKTAQATQKPLQILATIKPLYLLASEIAGKSATTALLIPATMDTHDYSFRPSDLRKLARTDVILRISPHLETFLNNVIEKSPDKHLITLEQTAGLHWLDIRAGHHHAHEQHHAHQPIQHSEHDYHIWLDPVQVGLLVDEISRQLSQLDPAHAPQYSRNSQQLKQRIDAAYRQSQQQLQSLQETPYLVFHDAWHYLEHAYGLRQPHILSLQEGLPPGLKTMLELRQHIREEKIHCLIASPHSNKRLIQSLVEDLPVQAYWLSPVATNRQTSSYANWMRDTAQQFAGCLSNSRRKFSQGSQEKNKSESGTSVPPGLAQSQNNHQHSRLNRQASHQPVQPQTEPP